MRRLPIFIEIQITHQLLCNITLLEDELHMQTVHAHMTAALFHSGKLQTRKHVSIGCSFSYVAAFCVLLLKMKNCFFHLAIIFF